MSERRRSAFGTLERVFLNRFPEMSGDILDHRSNCSDPVGEFLVRESPSARPKDHVSWIAKINELSAKRCSEHESALV